MSDKKGFARQSFMKNLGGFTLIELLVVISIVSLLSSVVYANAATGRVKAQDAKKIAEARQVETAVRLFVEDNGRAPLNYNGNDIAIEGTSAYESSMQELVGGGYLAKIPETGDPYTPYTYYDFGEGSVAGAVFGTELKSVSAGDSGFPGSCRPFRHVFAITDALILPPENFGTFHYSSGPSCDYGGFGDYPDSYTYEEAMELYNESYATCWEQGGGGICGGDTESSDHCVCVTY